MSKKKHSKTPRQTAEFAAVTLGSRLQDARKAANLTCGQLHQHTRVPLEAIEALEADNHEKLPAAVYTRGFVKLLCAELDLSWEEISGMLPEIQSSSATSMLAVLDTPRLASGESADREEEKQSQVSMGLVLFILVVIASLAISYFASQKERESQQTPSASEVTQVDVTG